MKLHETVEYMYDSRHKYDKVLKDVCLNNETEKASSYVEEMTIHKGTSEFQSEIIRGVCEADDPRSGVEKIVSNEHFMSILNRPFPDAPLSISESKVKKDTKRICYANVRTSCIRLPDKTGRAIRAERSKTCTKGSASKKTVIYGCNTSTGGTRNYETINQRCMQLYDAAMQKIKIENERKKQMLRDEERSAGLVGIYGQKNMVHCNKLYELNKEKNAIGKKRREEIRTRISKSNLRPLGRSTTSLPKDSRRSERTLHGLPSKITIASTRGILSQSLRNTNHQNRSTLLCERAIRTLERTLETDREVKEKKKFMNEKVNRVAPRFLHLYESGKRKIRTKRKCEGQGPILVESSTASKVSETNRRCKELYQLSKSAQNFGRQRREDIETAAAAKAKNNGSFRLRT